MKKSKINIVQENTSQCINLIETSFLKNAFTSTTTDVYYNGKDIFAQDNYKGRFNLNIKVSEMEVYELIKKIANYMLKNFSTQNPVLDVAFGNYRLSAVHPSLARFENKKVTTFSLRKISPTLKIKENDQYLAPIEVQVLLKILIQCYQSIIISGTTGSGKTELQKFLVSYMHENDRIILIEESYETYLKEIYPSMDITSWIINQNSNLSQLIKLALRNNPDWIIVAETRGNEAYDMINSVLTGHPIITTIHSEGAKHNLSRIVQMCKKDIEFDEKIMTQTIAKNLKIGVHIEKIYDENKKMFIRRISEIVEYVPTEFSYSINYLYNVYNKKHDYISDELFNDLKKHFVNLDLIKLKWRKKNEN